MLSEEKRAELKEKYPNDTLSIIRIGVAEIVFKSPKIEDIGLVRQKQFDLYVKPQQEGFDEKREKAIKDEPKDERSSDEKMADFVFKSFVVYPESVLPNVSFGFAEWFMDNYIYPTIGEVEEL